MIRAEDSLVVDHQLVKGRHGASWISRLSLPVGKVVAVAHGERVAGVKHPQPIDEHFAESGRGTGRRARYDVLLRMSRGYAQRWHEWDVKVAAIAGHLEATGQEPALVNSVWDSPTGALYLSSEHLPVYLAAARERLTTL